MPIISGQSPVVRAWDLWASDGCKLRHERRETSNGKQIIWRGPGGEPGITELGYRPADLLYGEPFLKSLPPGSQVFLTEGEPAADALRKVGFAAVATVCGAQQTITDRVAQVLAPFEVLLWPDADDHGREHMARNAGQLKSVGGIGRTVTWPAAPPKGDAADLIKAGGGRDHVLELISTAADPPLAASPTSSDESDQSDKSPRPEPVDRVALHGLAGKVVETLLPHTEADEMALLTQFLALVGNMIGRSAHFVAEGERHYFNLFVTLVGLSGKGRKGSSLAQLRRLCESVDPAWAKNEGNGLSSGEGLIAAVQDAVEKRLVDKAGEVSVEIVEEGVLDKRLVVVESEFASTLKVLGREGNTLSPILRKAWDRGDLRTMTRKSPLRATGAHITVIGHIVGDELRRYLTDTEMGNGFGNRFLWVAVGRSKMLPFGGKLSEVEFFSLITELRTVVTWARSVGEMRLDPEARGVWATVYPGLSEGRDGLLGAVTGRAEPQVMRLAGIYAVLDMSQEIQRDHVLAALAIWEYCEASAAYVFGDATGDSSADEIITALRGRPKGMSRTQVRDLFARHGGVRVQVAIDSLLDRGLIRKETAHTGGRPEERFHAA